MRSCAVLLCLASWLPSSTWAEPHEYSKVAVLLRFEKPPSAMAARAAELRLRSLMLPAHVNLAFSTDPRQVFVASRLVVVDMRGYCGMDASPFELAAANKPLGETSSSDGRILPFVRVNCDEVRKLLTAEIGSGNPQEHQTLFGASVAKVIAHELYHVLADSPEHTLSGLTQPALTSSALSSPSMQLPDEAADAIAERIGGR